MCILRIFLFRQVASKKTPSYDTIINYKRGVVSFDLDEEYDHSMQE